ncbi:fasciclin-like arabinogalactan protein 2 [Wolffia australiana]
MGGRMGAAMLAVLIVLAAIPVSLAFNITTILAEHPEFSTFNHYLSATHLATEINQRNTITVLAVDNAGMAEVLAKHLSIFSLKNLLYLHVLADYFGPRRLHQITHRSTTVATLFQATGSAPGTTGYVNITDLAGGRVGFGAASERSNEAEFHSFFVKMVHDVPYKVSVIQITKMLRSPVAEAPTPAPSQYNLTLVMAKKGCGAFADLLLSFPAVAKAYDDNVDGGLTIFCPVDRAVEDFTDKFKKLTAEGKSSLLLFHGTPYYNSLQMLKTQNGVVTTLATTGSKNYNMTVQDQGEEVTLKTKSGSSKITGTVIDEQPLAIYTLDKVLRPWELFKQAEEEEEAGAPGPAKAPAKKKGKKAPEPVAAGPDGVTDDGPADDNSAGEVVAWSRGVAAVVVVVAAGLLL